MLCFECRCACDAEMLLDDCDCVHDIVKAHAVRIYADAELVHFVGHSGRVFDEPLHFGLGATITELEVVEHGVVLLCEALICILDVCDVGSHLVCVVAHADDGAVCIVGGLFGVASESLNERCREAGRGFHVIRRADLRRLVGLLCICHQIGCAVLE